MPQKDNLAPLGSSNDAMYSSNDPLGVEMDDENALGSGLESLLGFDPLEILESLPDIIESIREFLRGLEPILGLSVGSLDFFPEVTGDNMDDIVGAVEGTADIDPANLPELQILRENNSFIAQALDDVTDLNSFTGQFEGGPAGVMVASNFDPTLPYSVEYRFADSSTQGHELGETIQEVRNTSDSQKFIVYVAAPENGAWSGNMQQLHREFINVARAQYAAYRACNFVTLSSYGENPGVLSSINEQGFEPTEYVQMDVNGENLNRVTSYESLEAA